MKVTVPKRVFSSGLRLRLALTAIARMNGTTDSKSRRTPPPTLISSLETGMLRLFVIAAHPPSARTGRRVCTGFQSEVSCVHLFRHIKAFFENRILLGGRPTVLDVMVLSDKAEGL